MEISYLMTAVLQTLKLRMQKIANSYTYSQPFFMADEAPQQKAKDNVINEATLDDLEARLYADSKRAFAQVREWMETEGREEI